MNKLCILNNFKRENYYNKPYPHFELHNAFDEETYSKLEKDYVYFINFFKRKEEFKKNNIRMQINSNELLEDNYFKKSIWVDFIRYHTSIGFFKKIIDIFYEDILKLYPEINKLLNYSCLEDSNFLGIRKFKENNSYNFVADCQPGINTPCSDRISVRGPHVDNPVELIGGLFYLRDELDKSLGGDLVIHKINSDTKKIYFKGKAEVENIQDLSDAKTFKYKKNYAVFFINSIVSIHSITPREKTSHVRRLTNIIFETYKFNNGLFKLTRKNFFERYLNF
jgi:hypothetical protein